VLGGRYAPHTIQIWGTLSAYYIGTTRPNTAISGITCQLTRPAPGSYAQQIQWQGFDPSGGH